METGTYQVTSVLSTFIRSIALNHKTEDRPNFEQHFDPETGDITVVVPKEHRNKVRKVKLEYGETLQSKMRDFRWIVKADSDGNCTYPYVPLPKLKFEKLKKQYDFLNSFDSTHPPLCLQPILWRSIVLHESPKGSGTYVAKAPVPKYEGRWVGYYVNMFFKSDSRGDLFTIYKNEYQLTSKAWTYPNTLPFPDCHGEECVGNLL
jgi:hypothetical protein